MDRNLKPWQTHFQKQGHWGIVLVACFIQTQKSATNTTTYLTIHLSTPKYTQSHHTQWSTRGSVYPCSKIKTLAQKSSWRRLAQARAASSSLPLGQNSPRPLPALRSLHPFRRNDHCKLRQRSPRVAEWILWNKLSSVPHPSLTPSIKGSKCSNRLTCWEVLLASFGPETSFQSTTNFLNVFK